MRNPNFEPGPGEGGNCPDGCDCEEREITNEVSGAGQGAIPPILRGVGEVPDTPATESRGQPLA